MVGDDDSQHHKMIVLYRHIVLYRRIHVHHSMRHSRHHICRNICRLLDVGSNRRNICLLIFGGLVAYRNMMEVLDDQVPVWVATYRSRHMFEVVVSSCCPSAHPVSAYLLNNNLGLARGRLHRVVRSLDSNGSVCLWNRHLYRRLVWANI
ncbi:hypothetical protein TRFO_21340 [Tritrichomonas foetus]|uniref:Uncharacterized protein n=1 Tax=Tritrichomonas foetus TaxID=1144522 RepID=A0A1J4KE56_9EUKA|nr:hypothetical protein TRFO_21340 [Tritrichomonas foetus]|eukprot:OHT09711.1 hypothetical protein TRFO_21340 [Tritrichomonas foetus]